MISFNYSYLDYVGFICLVTTLAGGRYLGAHNLPNDKLSEEDFGMEPIQNRAIFFENRLILSVSCMVAWPIGVIYFLYKRAYIAHHISNTNKQTEFYYRFWLGVFMHSFAFAALSAYFQILFIRTLHAYGYGLKTHVVFGCCLALLSGYFFNKKIDSYESDVLPSVLNEEFLPSPKYIRFLAALPVYLLGLTIYLKS